jgi:hemolysin activation/secretion protein
LFAASLFLFFFSPAPPHGQTASEPAAIERTIPSELPQPTDAPTISALMQKVTNSSGTKRRFTLGAVNIDGATVFSQQELSPYFESYLASEIDETTLAEIAARISDRYRRTGYLLSYAMVPSQNIEAGMARLAVVEGRIGSVTLEGAGADSAAVEAIAAPLMEDAPLRGTTLERAIGLIRDFPGLKVTDVALTRSGMFADVYALKIKVVRDRVRGLGYMDNRGTDSIGRSRLYTSTSFSSVAINGDELRVDLFAMPGRRFRYLYGQLQGSVPIGRNGLRLSMAASKGDQQLLSTERFDGDSTNLLAQLSYPVLRSRALTIVGKLSINDWRSLGEEADSRKLRDRLRVARLGIEVSNEARTRLHGQFTLSRGLRFGEMTEVGDPLASRSDAGGRFTKAAFTAQATHPLSKKARLQVAVAGQYSDRPLLSAEEFSLGGHRIGRAFKFNALTGDRGIGGGLELSYRLAEPKRGLGAIDLFGYVDGGAAFEAKSTPVVNGSRCLASVGAGTRFTVARTEFSAQVGIPFAASTDKSSVRLFLSTYKSF